MYYDISIPDSFMYIRIHLLQVMYYISLQKQVGCFNHRVVTLVEDKLERQCLLEVCLDVED